jgi:hypothetical protein
MGGVTACDDDSTTLELLANVRSAHVDMINDSGDGLAHMVRPEHGILTSGTATRSCGVFGGGTVDLPYDTDLIAGFTDRAGRVVYFNLGAYCSGPAVSHDLISSVIARDHGLGSTFSLTRGSFMQDAYGHEFPMTVSGNQARIRAIVPKDQRA